MLEARGRQRRLILRGAAAAVVAAGGWTAWRVISESALSAGMGEAYDPWRTWPRERRIAQELAFAKYEPDAETVRAVQNVDPRLDLVRAAELAPSLLNSQPWRFRLDGSDAIEILRDDRRQLPVLDPDGTQALIAIGAALCNFQLAAEASGFRAEGAPTNGGSAVAGLRILRTDAAASSPLGDAIPRCHDYFGAYDPDWSPGPDLDAELDALTAAGRVRVLMLPPDTAAAASDAALRTMEQVVADPDSLQEIHRWFRQTRESIYLARDGINVDTFGLPLLRKVVLKVMPAMSPARFGRFLVEHVRASFAQDRTIGVVSLEGSGAPEDYLEAGRLWQTFRLWAQAKGLSVHSLDQSLMGALDRPVGGAQLALHELLAAVVPNPVMVWRMGRPLRPTIPGPRRWVGDMIET